MKRTIGKYVVLVALGFVACSEEINSPAVAVFDNGECYGCWLSGRSGLFSFMVRSDADYDSLLAGCFPENFRKRWLPPQPRPGEDLVYVSLSGSGCVGCLEITDIHDDSQVIVVEVEGGFQGPCDMWVVLGAWALIHETDRPVVFEFRKVICADGIAASYLTEM